MKKTILLFGFIICITTLFALPSEVYVAYQLKDGEKVKEIAERFHVPFSKLLPTINNGKPMVLSRDLLFAFPQSTSKR